MENPSCELGYVHIHKYGFFHLCVNLQAAPR